MYTGVIFDARGLNIRPAMSPKVLDEDGREVYGSAFVSQEWATKFGILGYVKDLDGAKKNDRVAANPLVIKASKVSGTGGCDLVISNADAQGMRDMSNCVTCHSDRAKAGGLTLASYDVARAAEHAGITEKIIRKLRAGMMPPAGARRPDAPTMAALTAMLENTVDRAADANRPGSRVFQRLNRAEYARAVRDLLALDIDVTGLLPADQLSAGFDNVSDSQMFSPTLMEAYLRAASKVTPLAVGDPQAESAEALYRVPKTASQMEPVDGAPLGTRGGLSVVHTFPADGDYSLRLELHGNACGFLFGGPFTGEQMEVSVDGERVALLDVNPKIE